ncbi:MAG: PKD domain-containing protein [Planctomycetota bacterium]|nr:PKD domain-containing protein [Planctomycetota bacterium]
MRNLLLEGLESRVLMAVGDLRIVSYNIVAGMGDGLPQATVGSVLKAIGDEVYNGRSRRVDVVAMQEVLSQTQTAQAVVNQLNTAYGIPGLYARGTLNGNQFGFGQGIVYNTQTIQLVSQAGIGTASGSGQARQALRYLLRPLEVGLGNDFYLYNSHYKAVDSTEDAARRAVEAQAIRADADALPANTHIIFAGDFNMYTSNELGYTRLIATGNAQAIDPINRPGNWTQSGVPLNIFTQAPLVNPPSGLVGGGLDDRFDFQLLTGEWFDGVGLEYVPGSYRTFANNGTVSRRGSITDASNTALPTRPDRLTVLNNLGTTSDHLPVVADYRFVTATSQPAAIPFSGSNYTEDFNTLPYYSVGDFATTGNGPFQMNGREIGATGVDGWSFGKRSGTSTNSLFAIGDGGAATAGTIYSLGPAAGTTVVDRALGALASTTFVGTFGATFINQTAVAITNFTLNYVGEMWRNESNAPNTLTFEYCVGANNLLDAGASTFTAVTGLDFTSPAGTATVTKLDGNSAANRTARSATVNGINWLPGQNLVLRWRDADDMGSDDILGIDDVVFSAVLNTNDPPTAINLSNSSINENAVINSVVGNLSTLDPNPGDTFTYSLVAGTGAVDNASFNILNNQLRINNPFNFEVKSSYSIRISTRDQSGANFSQAFVITVNDLNESPTAETTGGYTGLVGQPISVLGAGSDPDVGQTLSYEWDFNFNGTTFVPSATGFASSITYTSAGNRTVALRVSDSGTPRLSSIATTTIQVSAAVVGRHIFYRGSSFDTTPDSQQAIDTSKVPLTSGRATRANVSNYDRGLNGVIVDIAGANASSIGLFDFELSTGNTNTPTSWSLLSSSAFVTVNPLTILPSPLGPGIVRVKFNFVDNAIARSWLQISVLANARTGLARTDTFLFGSAPGDVYIDPIAQRVNAMDSNAIRTAISSRPIGVGRIEDITKDGFVSADDLRSARRIVAAAPGLRWLTLGAPLSIIAPSASTASNKSSLDSASILNGENAIDIALGQLDF